MTRNEAIWIIKSIEKIANDYDCKQFKWLCKKHNITTSIDYYEICYGLEFFHENHNFSMQLDYMILGFNGKEKHFIITQITDLMAFLFWFGKIKRVDKCVVCGRCIVKWNNKESLTCSNKCRQRKRRKELKP